MTRNLLLAAAALGVVAVPAEAKRVLRPYTSIEKLARADIVVTGKVTAVEKETVDLIRYAGDKEKAPHRVAVIKIDKPLVGGAGITHVKVGFIPPAPSDPPTPPIRAGEAFKPIDLKEGQVGVYFLTRHPSGDIYTITPMMGHLESAADNFKTEAALVTKAAAALADPVKALNAEKADDRFFAAAALLTKYRTSPERGGETEMAKVSLEESQLVLKAVAEADWTKTDDNGIGPMQAFYQLGLNPAAKFQFPNPKEGGDFPKELKAAFVTWLGGAGKEFQIAKIVPKVAHRK